jgi:hypothetical protein
MDFGFGYNLLDNTERLKVLRRILKTDRRRARIDIKTLRGIEGKFLSELEGIMKREKEPLFKELVNLTVKNQSVDPLLEEARSGIQKSMTGPAKKYIKDGMIEGVRMGLAIDPHLEMPKNLKTKYDEYVDKFLQDKVLGVFFPRFEKGIKSILEYGFDHVSKAAPKRILTSEQEGELRAYTLNQLDKEFIGSTMKGLERLSRFVQPVLYDGWITTLSESDKEELKRAYFVTTSGGNTCPECLDRADESETVGGFPVDDLPSLPGDGSTYCKEFDNCLLETGEIPYHSTAGEEFTGGEE